MEKMRAIESSTPANQMKWTEMRLSKPIIE